MILHVPDKAAFSSYVIPATAATDARRRLEPAIVPFQFVDPLTPALVTSAYVPTAPAVASAVLAKTQFLSGLPVRSAAAATLGAPAAPSAIAIGLSRKAKPSIARMG